MDGISDGLDGDADTGFWFRHSNGNRQHLQGSAIVSADMTTTSKEVERALGDIVDVTHDVPPFARDDLDGHADGSGASLKRLAIGLNSRLREPMDIPRLLKHSPAGESPAVVHARWYRQLKYHLLGFLTTSLQFEYSSRSGAVGN